jgi:hypothetical protein
VQCLEKLLGLSAEDAQRVAAAEPALLTFRLDFGPGGGEPWWGNEGLRCRTGATAAAWGSRGVGKGNGRGILRLRVHSIWSWGGRTIPIRAQGPKPPPSLATRQIPDEEAVTPCTSAYAARNGWPAQGRNTLSKKSCNREQPPPLLGLRRSRAFAPSANGHLHDSASHLQAHKFSDGLNMHKA